MTCVMDFSVFGQFGTPAHKLSRTAGPETSAAAAQAVDTSAMERAVLKVIAGALLYGTISDRVRAQFPGKSYSSITARYKALADKGLIAFDGHTRAGDSGRQQRVMYVTPLGLASLAS